MSLRVSQIVVSLVLLDDYDAPKNAEPITFAGDADGTAADKLAAWVAELPAKIAAAENAATAER